MKKAGKIFLFVFGIFLLWLFIAQLISITPKENICDENTEIYVFDYGYHTAIIFPAEKISSDLRKQLPGDSGTKFYEFAWGEKEFFSSEGFSYFQAVRALLTPCSSVVYVRAYDGAPEENLAHNFAKFRVCKEKISPALQLIEDSFSKNDDGKIFLFRNGSRKNSAYFHSDRTYWFYNNCNVWTSEILEKLDKPRPLWAGTSWSVMRLLN